MTFRWIAATFIALGLSALPLAAHHSFAAEYDDTKPVKVTGVVTRVEWLNPHVWFYVDVKDDKGKVVNWAFSDLDRCYTANLENCALTCLADRRSEAADATVTLERATLNRVVLRELTFADAVARGLVRVQGDAAKVADFFGLLDDFSLMFEVLEPRRAAPAPPGS